MAGIDLRAYVFLDSLQAQYAAFLGTVAQGFLPLPGDASLYIEVSPGIDPEALHRIFEPLEQAESLNTRTHQGVGLGLTLARMSANAMDGDVVLESTGPNGSTFLWTVTRPVT